MQIQQQDTQLWTFTDLAQATLASPFLTQTYSLIHKVPSFYFQICKAAGSYTPLPVCMELPGDAFPGTRVHTGTGCGCCLVSSAQSITLDSHVPIQGACILSTLNPVAHLLQA